MGLDRVKQFTLKNGEFLGDISAFQSGYSGGMPCGINSAGSIIRAYSDTGWVGIYANGSNVDVSGAPVTFYTGNGIFTLELVQPNGAPNAIPGETVYPYDATQTYHPGDSLGITSGLWSNTGYATAKARVLAVGSVSGGTTTSLTMLLF